MTDKPAFFDRLKRLIELKCLTNGVPITLSSQGRSSVYFDCKPAMLDGECLTLIADGLLYEINRFPVTPSAIGGLTMGADFMVSALIAKAYATGHATVNGSIVRKKPKDNRPQTRIENKLKPGTKIVVVDDVITTGRSISEACKEFIQEGYEVAGIVAIIDRQEGGRRHLEKDYGLVRTFFKKGDFVSNQHGGKLA